MRKIDNFQDVQIVLKELTDWKDNQISKAKDQRGLQIKNCGAAVDETDVVILKQLKQSTTNIIKKQAPPTAAAISPGTVSGAGEFSFQAENVSANPGVPVAVNHFSVDITQNQRVNFCYTPVAVTLNNLVVNIILSTDFGVTWQTLEQMTIAVGSQQSWAGQANPPATQSTPYNQAAPYTILTAGNLLNFTIEAGAASGLTIKLDTKVNA